MLLKEDFLDIQPEDNASVSSIEELALLWVRAQPRIAGFIAAGVADFHVVEDILQEVALQVARNFESYDRERPFVPWALGIARNTIAAHYRKASNQKLIFSDPMLDQLSSALLRMDETYIDDRKEALRKCIKSLRTDSQEIVSKRYLAALSIAQVAEQMEMSVTAVSVRLHRARKSLAECVQRRLATR